MPLVYTLTELGQDTLTTDSVKSNLPQDYRRLLAMIEVGGHIEVLRGRLRRFPDRLIDEWLQELQQLKMIDAHEAGDLIERLAKQKVPGEVKPEVTLSMIELNSSVQQGFAGALAELEAQRAAVLEAAGVLNLGVCGGGAQHRRRRLGRDRDAGRLDAGARQAHADAGTRDGVDAVWLVAGV